ncbi:MAG: TIGR03435 family protein, partial [Acidobacteriaceae bacterium]
PPSFDVISVKPNKTSLGVHGLIITEFTADGFRGTNVPVHTLLLQAYGLHEGESVGEPAWANSEVFDIEAKVAGPDVAAFSKLDSDQLQAMLRQILAERFGLVAHRETRELPVYAMSVAKGGPKLKEFVFDPAVPASARRGGGVQMSMGMIAAHECTIPYFLSMLSRQLGRTVVDRTGLTGNYDFTLRWSPDNSATSASEGAQADTLPSIFTAVQEQLGLKLESTKAPASVLVVDHLERPSQN